MALQELPQNAGNGLVIPLCASRVILRAYARDLYLFENSGFRGRYSLLKGGGDFFFFLPSFFFFRLLCRLVAGFLLLSAFSVGLAV